MPHSLDQILPSLQALGVWTYWAIALFAMLEAIVGVGIVAPGALVVFAGGMLVQRGVLDPFDLGWFVIAGTVLGGEISYRLGRLAAHGLEGSRRFTASRHMIRAKALLARYGALAMLIGRLSGPLSAFVPFSAAIADMSRRRFVFWNVASAFPYTLIHLSLGYFFGGAIGTMGAAAPRILAVGAAVLAVLALVWYLLRRLRRALPLLAEIGHAVGAGLARKPFARRLIDRHPKLAAFMAERFATARFLGLTFTVLAVLFLYVLTIYFDSVFDFLVSPDVASADTRIANMFYALRDDRLIAVFGWITGLGSWKIVITMLVGATAALMIQRRHALAGGLWIAAVGNQLCVALLKSFFDRPRSALGYFTETSASFPSGHAAASVAVWGMLFYLAWRTRLLSAEIAGLIAVTLAVLIGFSRIYLVEHYLSDVLNGYLVGALWLIIGVAFCEWRRDRIGRGTAPRNHRLSLGVITTAALMALVLASTQSAPLNTVSQASPITARDPVSILGVEPELRETQTLAGAPRQPVNLMVVAQDPQAIGSAMQDAGWILAPKPGLGVLARAVWADWTGAAMPRPLVIPTFWNNQPSDLGFARPDDSPSDTLRLHARFWRTDFTTGERMILVGTLTSEDPIDWLADPDDPAPSLAPAPAQLDALIAALRSSGLVALAVR